MSIPNAPSSLLRPGVQEDRKGLISKARHDKVLKKIVWT